MTKTLLVTINNEMHPLVVGNLNGRERLVRQGREMPFNSKGLG